MDFEDVLSQVGRFGKYQKLLLLFLIPVSILSSMLSNEIFLKLTPDHWCSVPELMNFSYGEQHRFIRPVSVINNSEPVMETCVMFDVNYKEVVRDLRLPLINNTNNKKLAVKSCDNGWIYDRTRYWESVVTHYNFVCEQSDGFSIISTVRLIGCIFGTPLFGLISDVYGRRVGYLAVLLTVLISSISPLLCKDYTVFVICQFIIGLTFPSSHTIVFIMILELVGPQDRAKVVSCLFMSLYLGTCLQSVIVYFVPHWFWITVINTAIVLPFIVVLRFIPESPQWLLTKEKYETVEQIFKNIMRINCKSIPLDLLSMQIQKIGKNRKHSSQEKIGKNIIMKYLKDTTLFQIWLILMLCFVINLMSNQIFEAKKLEFDSEILVNTFFWSFIKTPAILITWFIIQRRVGRRLANSMTLVMIGLTLIGLAFTPKNKKTLTYTISLLGILLNKASIMITYIQVVELSPTKTRCLALSTSTTVAILLVTFINYIYSMENFNNWLPLIVLSVICLSISFLASFLTETLRENIPQNVSEAEDLINNMTYWRFAKRKCDIKSNVFISLSQWNINEMDEFDNS